MLIPEGAEVLDVNTARVQEQWDPVAYRTQAAREQKKDVGRRCACGASWSACQRCSSVPLRRAPYVQVKVAVQRYNPTTRQVETVYEHNRTQKRKHQINTLAAQVRSVQFHCCCAVLLWRHLLCLCHELATCIV